MGNLIPHIMHIFNIPLNGTSQIHSVWACVCEVALCTQNMCPSPSSCCVIRLSHFHAVKAPY